MKRKQKTPRRIRPTETSDDVDGVNMSPMDTRPPASCDVKTKKQKMEAETQTENVDAIKMQAPNTVNTMNSRNSGGTFKNERDSNGMPLILNVFSLSEGSPRTTKKLDMLSRQANGFPVTPPCSPPLVQLGPFHAIPVMSRNSQVRQKNANSCAFSTDNFGAQTAQDRNNVSADPRMYHHYKQAEATANTSSQLIANGVLPTVEHNTYGRQYGYADVDDGAPSGHFGSYVGGDNSGKSPILQLTSTFSLGNKYLVPKGSYVAKGSSGVFTRFKLQRNAIACENKPPIGNVPSMVAGEFPTQTTPKNARQCIDPKNDEYGVGDSSRSFACLLQRASVAYSQRNGRSDIGDGAEVSSSSNRVVMPTDNQKNYSQSYPGFRQGYGRNEGSCHPKQPPAVSTNGNLYLTRVSLSSNPAPCAPSKEQSSEAEQSSWSSASSGDERTDFVSPRDARVKKLKKLLEEQEAKVNRLRTSH